MNISWCLLQKIVQEESREVDMIIQRKNKCIFIRRLFEKVRRKCLQENMDF